MGKRLGHMDQAITDVVTTFVVDVHRMSVNVGEWLRNSPLAGHDISDPFDGGDYDWDSDPDGRVW